MEKLSDKEKEALRVYCPSIHHEKGVVRCRCRTHFNLVEAERERWMHVIDLVKTQSGDEGLWFTAMTAPEGYLQQELRKLHALVENDQWYKRAAAIRKGES